MDEVSIIGVDLAKHVFQLHGAAADGRVVFRRRVRREQLLPFLAARPACGVVMEACGSAHYWAREIGALGHRVRLVAPAYVKPFVKRQKNDAADAEAIVEAAQRPTMRFVAVKSAEQQASAMVFKTRDLLVRQRTSLVNALRAHMAEFGLVAPKGICHVGRLEALLAEDTTLPEPVRRLCGELLALIAGLTERLGVLDREVRERARTDELARRLQKIPGIGPVTALALAVLAPPPETFERGRDLAAWIGLTPRQHSSGGVSRLGKTSKMGQRDLRRLLIIGASAVVRWARRPQHGERLAPKGSWLAGMLARKPPMLVVVALANKMARVAWALMARGDAYRAPAPAS
ncbi:MAG: IS110 family transposase [Geminicoccaceae bacterium]|nr:IS110 family transposase [Geminicoccaceae bacterium]